jgi:hypothetical protein
MARLGSDYTANEGASYSLTSSPSFNCAASGVPANATLDSVEVYGRDNGTATLRVAVYEGGTSNTDFQGATLVWDSGASSVLEGVASNQWNTITAGGESLTSGTRLWLAIKGLGGALRYRTPDLENGDWEDQTDRDSTIDNDTSVAFPSTLANAPDGGTGYSIKSVINYTESGGASVGPFGALSGEGGLAGMGGIAGKGGGLA